MGEALGRYTLHCEEHVIRRLVCDQGRAQQVGLAHSLLGQDKVIPVLLYLCIERARWMTRSVGLDSGDDV